MIIKFGDILQVQAQNLRSSIYWKDRDLFGYFGVCSLGFQTIFICFNEKMIGTDHAIMQKLELNISRCMLNTAVGYRQNSSVYSTLYCVDSKKGRFVQRSFSTNQGTLISQKKRSVIG